MPQRSNERTVTCAPHSKPLRGEHGGGVMRRVVFLLRYGTRYFHLANTLTLAPGGGGMPDAISVVGAALSGLGYLVGLGADQFVVGGGCRDTNEETDNEPN